MGDGAKCERDMLNNFEIRKCITKTVDMVISEEASVTTVAKKETVSKVVDI